ncbi:MAG: uroporphyrinogen-III synthase, partial [Ruminococcus sp.]
DPFVFGRGGEEAQALVEAGISFEIVPGVSSCYSVPAYAGIPVTHRDYASSFHVITGHTQLDPKNEPDYVALAKLDGTLVFLMGLTNLPHIAAALMRNGKAADTPIAVIQKGTTARQKTVTGTLSNIVEAVTQQSLQAPVTIVIGEVVSLRNELQWFERGALFGKKILLTGTPPHSRHLAEHLQQYGAETIEISLIDTVPTMNHALQSVDWSMYTWIVFSSANSVHIFFDSLQQYDIDLRMLMHLRFAAIGNGTACELAAKGIFVDCVPERFESRYLAEALISKLEPHDRVLLIRSKNGSSVLPDMLKAAEKNVDSILLYETKPLLQKKELLQAQLSDVDYLVFSSSSAVQAFVQMWEKGMSYRAKAISIGDVTTKTAIESGISIAATAQEATAEGILSCILQDVEQS